MNARNMVSRGQVHVYTGNGKGKTTAAFGLAIRACMAGKKVFIGQFMKSMQYNETRIARYIDNLSVEQFGNGCILTRAPNEVDRRQAQDGMHRCAELLGSGNWDVVIFDEITIALHMENRDAKTEVVLTGRHAPKQLIDYADLVTDMQEVKHYYASKGLLSRNGIDR